MRKYIFFTTGWIILLFVSCKERGSEKNPPSAEGGDSCRVYEKRARRADSILMYATGVDTVQSLDAQKAFLDMAYFCTENKKSPEYLIKAVQLALQEKNFAMAKKGLDFAEENFTQSSEYPMILFMLGELYADAEQLNDPEKAEQYFSRLEKEYPSSTWAKMVPDARKWIGKSKSSISQ